MSERRINCFRGSPSYLPRVNLTNFCEFWMDGDGIDYRALLPHGMGSFFQNEDPITPPP